MPFCTTCGHENVDTARFCYRCGQPTLNATPPPNQADPQPEPEPEPSSDSKPTTPTWGREQTKGCIIILVALGVVIAVTLVLIASLCGENIPEDPEERRQWESEKQTQEAVKEFEEQTKAAENVATEAEQALDQQRKDAGLPSCKDIGNSAITSANLRGVLSDDIKDLDDHRLERVDVESDTPSITCSAKANLDNIWDGYGFIQYVGKWEQGILNVSVSKSTKRLREDATKEARN